MGEGGELERGNLRSQQILTQESRMGRCDLRWEGPGFNPVGVGDKYSNDKSISRMKINRIVRIFFYSSASASASARRPPLRASRMLGSCRLLRRPEDALRRQLAGGWERLRSKRDTLAN